MPPESSEKGQRMPFYEERVLPRLIDVVLGGPFEKTRARVAGGLGGQVLEIGFGSGRNVPHYPDGVNHVWAVDPSTTAREIAAKRIASSTVPIDFIGLDGQQLSLPDAVADHVLVTWTLCTIPDVAGALLEMNRVLRPGGELHFVEHGRAADPRMARWQDHLTPAWKKISGGCHLNRPIPDIIAASGLVIEGLTTYTVPRSGPFGYMFEGIASKPPAVD